MLRYLYMRAFLSLLYKLQKVLLYSDNKNNYNENKINAQKVFWFLFLKVSCTMQRFLCLNNNKKRTYTNYHKKLNVGLINYMDIKFYMKAYL
jgi:hypothetical protein